MLTAVALGAGADIASLRQSQSAGAQTLPAAGQESFDRGDNLPLQGTDERGTIETAIEEQKFLKCRIYRAAA
ncbi:MAG: hypothetical protein MR014_10330 [Oscillospiraceae bacterium]|nr:hypothetical protein [Oscillospiraceae bacterium]